MAELEDLAFQNTPAQVGGRELQHQQYESQMSYTVPPCLNMEAHHDVPDSAPLEHLLRFYTSVAKLGSFNIENTRRAGYRKVVLDIMWRKMQSYQLDLLRLGWTTSALLQSGHRSMMESTLARLLYISYWWNSSMESHT